MPSMDLECGSVTISSSSAANSAAEDRLVEMELEAAEVLADLAHSAKRERGGGGEAARNWGCRGKRVSKRVKSKSPPGPSGFNLNLADPVPGCSDPANDQAQSDQPHDQTVSSDVIIIKAVKSEQDAEFLKPSSIYSRRFASMSNSRRQNLTEAEKEERRMRRILANRESARQTIRRRQALCEELTRKAADLTKENENLKMHKELALKEYQSLENVNKHLKEKMAKLKEPEVGQTPGEQKSTHVVTSPSPSTNRPLQLYDHHPFPPLGWHSLVKPSHPILQHNRLQMQHSYFISTSSSLSPAYHKPDSSQEEENTKNVNATQTPLYMVPCPWFFPIHDQPSLIKSIQNETFMHNVCDSSSNTVNVKREISGSSQARVINDLNVPPVGFVPNGSNQVNGSDINAAAAGTLSVKYGNMLQSDYACSGESTSVKKVNHVLNSLPKRIQEPVCLNRKLDAAEATEARRRRKELTKMKNLHGRQCRIHH